MRARRPQVLLSCTVFVVGAFASAVGCGLNVRGAAPAEDTAEYDGSAEASLADGAASIDAASDGGDMDVSADASDASDAADAGSPLPKVAGGARHTCAVTGAGALRCWGENGDDQLGDGSGSNSRVPVDAVGFAGPQRAVATGSQHTCALAMTGGVKCVGYGLYGQLGNGSKAASSMPVAVTGLTSGVAAIASGDVADYACAVTTSGGAKCWGRNDTGQLGDGSDADRSTPVDVTGLTSGVASIAVGRSHTCAVTTAGGAKCWGENDRGQLGNDSTSASRTPVDVAGLGAGVVALALGNQHTCALTTAGGVKCWGANGIGQLGDASFVDADVPVNVSGLSSGVVAIATGGYFTCAVTSSGGVKCWGMNDNGQLGDGTADFSSVPVDVMSLSNAASIATGFLHACAVTNTGGIRCWGYNASGQLGNDSVMVSRVPVQVVGFP